MRTISLSMILTLGFAAGAGCATPSTESAAPSTVAPKARPAEAVKAEFSSTCQSDCERSRQAQAVAWEMIVAECQRGCESDWDAAFVSRASELDPLLGQKVRAVGMIDVDQAVPVLLLEGGAVVLASGPAVLDLTRFAKAKVTLVGTLRTEGEGHALDGVSGVVKLEE